MTDGWSLMVMRLVITQLTFPGVMLSHDNVYWTCMQAIDIGPVEYDREVVISYLPLSHIAASLMDIWAAFLARGTVVFADRMALKGTLLQTLKEARPTMFMGVPRYGKSGLDINSILFS